jgi:hypothetical protein
MPYFTSTSDRLLMKKDKIDQEVIGNFFNLNKVIYQIGPYYSILNTNADDILIEYWDSLSLRERKKFVSGFSLYGKNALSTKKMSSALSRLCRLIKIADPKGFKLLLSNSSGFIAFSAFYDGNAEDRIKLAKRFKTFKSAKFRRIAAESLPHSLILDMLDDKDYGVVNRVVKRLGIENVYKKLLNSPLSGHLYRFINLCSKDELLKIIQSGTVDPSKGYVLHELAVTRLAELLNPEEILFHLDLLTKYHNLEKILKLKTRK